MASADIAVRTFRQLENEDLRVLQAIETAMSQHESVPKKLIAKFTKFDLARETSFRLDHLSKIDLIRYKRGAYAGYTLNYAGYDCLAINALVRAGILEAFGKPLGVGKEADVYDALNPKGERIAVKFHRLGRISFRQTTRKRSYAMQQSAGWLFQSRRAAEQEYQALKLLHSHRVAVPRPLNQNRHVIAMGMIEGIELVNCRRLSKAEKVLLEILRNIRKTYLKARIIHADLSEYNIILKPDEHVLIIDWPQYTSTEHPNAEELLKRDLHNVLHYFERKHRLVTDIQKAINYVTGQRKTPIAWARRA